MNTGEILVEATVMVAELEPYDVETGLAATAVVSRAVVCTLPGFRRYLPRFHRLHALWT